MAIDQLQLQAPTAVASKLPPHINTAARKLEPAVDTHKSLGLLVDRANEQLLKKIFDKYATASIENEKAIRSSDLVQKFLGLLNEGNANEKTLKFFANLADLNKDGFITYDEFKLFEEILCSPDVLFRCAFQLFDIKGTGAINFDSFKEILSHTLINEQIPFDFKSDLITMYFGGDRQRQINYQEFSQILHDFHEEHALQAFKKYEKNGFILPANFVKIMHQLKNQLLSPYLKENLNSIIHSPNHAPTISYPYFMGFISLLNNMELMKQIYKQCVKDNHTKEITKGQFMKGAQQFYQVTPLEIEILYSLVSYFRPDGKVSLADIEKISPMGSTSTPYHLIETKLTDQNPQDRNVSLQVLESVYRFALGSIAGAIGAFAVYPIDLVKTRMQNQRSKSYVGEVMYRNSWDCFKKTLRHEGVLGLYKGLLVQLIGVAPEKAIKLTVNDLVRDKFRQYTGHLPFYGEVIAGGCAGGCQVIFTNPMEIVKIRMQVAGEIQQNLARSERTIKIVRELGFFGLYKGVRACLLRDIPFSAIYFPAYNYFKRKFADENGNNSLLSLFCAGFSAGVPAAGLCTPADVIKTRIQVKERLGQTQYKGVIDAAAKIYKEEGARAFWKGTAARVFRSSPQFGVTLLSYEFLQALFYVDFGGYKQQADGKATVIDASKSTNPDHVGGYRLATVAFAGLENKFGLCFPKYNKI